MTVYGTIPTSTSNESSTATCRTEYAVLRPWRELVHLHAFSLPPNLHGAHRRIRANGNYFTKNYVIIVLFIVFLSLIYHPISIIVFILTMFAWLSLYFLRKDPVFLLCRAMDDRCVLLLLSLVTLLPLLLTGAAANVLISLLAGLILVLLHAACMRIDDLFPNDAAAKPIAACTAGEKCGEPSQSSPDSTTPGSPKKPLGPCFPRFDGQGDPALFLRRAEEYFEADRTHEGLKVYMASYALDGNAKIWGDANAEFLREGFTDWEGFKGHFTLRFKKS